MRTPLSSSIVVVLVMAAALTATPPSAVVRAQSRGTPVPLPAKIDTPSYQTFNGINIRPATRDQQDYLDTLVLRLTEAANGHFRRMGVGWNCLKAERLKSPWIVSVTTTVWTLDPTMDNKWSVAVSVWVKTKVDAQPEETVDLSRYGSRSRRYQPDRGSNRGSESLIIVAGDQLREALEDVASKGPCPFTLKLKGSRTVPLEGALIKYEWEGEQRLHLGPDGAFEGSVPVKMLVNASVADCTITAAIDIGLAVAGSYRDNGQLVFTKMDSPLIPSTATVRCPDTPLPRSVPIRPWWGPGSWMHEREAGLPLEDGARVSLRPQWLVAEPGTGEMTLELEYVRSGPRPVAAVPRP